VNGVNGVNGRVLAMRTTRVSVAVVAALFAAACEPCAGVSNCRTGAHVSIGGRLVDRTSERPVANGLVSFVRTSGIGLASDSLSARTDADGFFLLSTLANGDGNVVGRLDVQPPAAAAYSVDGLVVPTTTERGDGSDLGRILSAPFAPFIGELHDRITGRLVAGAQVTFIRQGGVRLTADSLVASSDASGRFYLETVALNAGTVFGKLVVVPPAGFAQPIYTIPIAFSTEFRDIIPRGVTVLHLGTTLLWVGEIYRRGSNSLLQGISVDFQRTAGVAITPDHFTAVTDARGAFPIQPMPASDGTLVGDIVIHSPPPLAVETVRSVTITTHSDDSVRLAGRWGIGPQVFGAIEFWYRTTQQPLSAVAAVVFRRVAGPSMERDSIATLTNATGVAGIEGASADTGLVSADVIVRLGAPYGDDTVRVTVPSRSDDIQRFYGVYTVGRWFPQVAQVLDDASGAPISGATITFRRTSGVAVAPDPFTVTSDANGVFGLRPQPQADGDVTGDMLVHAPSYPDTVIQGVRLTSSRSDNLQFIGVFRIRKP
jgi:hypothetical protein